MKNFNVCKCHDLYRVGTEYVQCGFDILEEAKKYVESQHDADSDSFSFVIINKHGDTELVYGPEGWFERSTCGQELLRQFFFQDIVMTPSQEV